MSHEFHEIIVDMNDELNPSDASYRCKLSIVVPCYNAEAYVKQCLDSVLNQTLEDIEIICVNDGSTDNTLKLLKDFAAKDSRIFIIDKQNSGYGDSMNKGISYAHGQYIGIVESVDFIEPEMFETLYNTAIEFDADIAKSNFWLYWSDPERNEFFEYFTKDECGKVITPGQHDGGSLYGRKPSVWSAIYKRALLNENNICFLTTPGASYQDTSFTFKVYSTAQKMVCLYDAFLHYRQDNDNSSINNAEKNMDYILEEHSEIKSFINKNPKSEQEYLYPIYGAAFYDTCIWTYERLTPKLRYIFLKKVSPLFKKLINDVGADKLNFGDMWWKRRDIVRIAEDPYEYHMWRNDERYDQNAANISYQVTTTPINNIEQVKAKENNKAAPEFSVIVPVYNVEKYLPSALDSLLYQNIKNIEIICINDGSEDHSLSVIESYAKMDERIVVINQENNGLAAARNSGLAVARGKYVAFLDSDDYLSENSLEILKKEIEDKGNPDAVGFGSELLPVSPKASDWIYLMTTTPDKYFDKIDEKIFLTTEYLRVFCWRFCFKTSFLRDNDLSFNADMGYGEDAQFLLNALPRASGVSIISDKLYHYRHARAGSLMDQNSKDQARFGEQQLLILEQLLTTAVNELHFTPSCELLQYSCSFMYGAVNNYPQHGKADYISRFLSLIEKFRLGEYIDSCSDYCKRFYNNCVNETSQAIMQKNSGGEQTMTLTVENVGKDICTGCGACHNVCPANAITMTLDSEGFLCPEINRDVCTACGLCYNKCPAVNVDGYQNNESPKVYAAYASDDIRMKSSSGGMFTVLAEHMIDQGGYAAGVRWDENFNAVFDIVNEKEKLALMRGSKYVQSNTDLVFRKIKQLLEEDKPVLFTGVPCQAAGLRHYLGKDYDNLYIIDILCHGSPSPKSFNKFLDSTVRSIDDEAGVKDITSIEFRSKERHGWNVSMVIRLNNGKEYDKSRNETAWYSSFLNILNCRRVCGQCRYNKLPRQGDITLGDFWGIEKVMPETDFHKGVSVVTINNEKGQKLFDEISDKLAFKRESNIEDAKASNWNLVGSSKSHKFRKRFFELLDMYDDYDKITDYALKRKFDIGYIGWWYGKNYGSILTNFALHQYLKSKKKSVLMIQWPQKRKPFSPVEDSMAYRFARKYYDVSMRRVLEDHYDLNWYCDSFLVGSDQLWNYWSTKEEGYFFFLDFVEDSKKKIAYSTSFGHKHYVAPNWHLKNASFHLSRFDSISVREKDGIDICRNIFGTDAVQNIDPVFICDKQEYINLINQSKISTDNPYIFAYILNPTAEKRQALLELSQITGLDIKVVLDAQFDVEANRKKIDMDDTLVVPEEIEDWLSLIYNSDRVFTDSYHGLCFSIIFEKQFSCIGNMRRGLSRFTTLLDSLNLTDQLLFDPMKAVEQADKKIDYRQVQPLLSAEIKRSKEWLDDALTAEKPHKASTYDLLMEKISKQQENIDTLQQQLDELRKMLKNKT